MKKDKKCNKCKEIKTLDCFYFDKGSNKFRYRCKECDKKAITPYQLVYQKTYFKTKKGRELLSVAARNSYLRHKDRWAARTKLRYAVKKGIIEKPTVCELYSPHPTVPCFGRIEAHHYKGYEGDNWAMVQWLCQKHHQILEKDIKNEYR